MADRVRKLRSGIEAKKGSMEHRAFKLKELVESYSRLYVGTENDIGAYLEPAIGPQRQDMQSVRKAIQASSTSTASPLLPSSELSDTDDDCILVSSPSPDQPIDNNEPSSTTREIVTDALAFAGEFIVFFGKKMAGIPIKFDDTKILEYELDAFRIGYSRIHRVRKQAPRTQCEKLDDSKESAKGGDCGEKDEWTIV